MLLLAGTVLSGFAFSLTAGFIGHQNDADSTSVSPTCLYTEAPLGWALLPSEWFAPSVFEKTFKFSLFKEEKPSCHIHPFNPSLSCTPHLQHRLLLLRIFECLCEASRNLEASGVGQGLA